jgi:hypothetical protein
MCRDFSQIIFKEDFSNLYAYNIKKLKEPYCVFLLGGGFK